MQRKIVVAVLAFFILALPAYAQNVVDYEALDAYITNAFNKSQATGLAVGIIKDGSIVFTKGYGVRNVETKAPIDSRTQFGIGSCSKAFTAASIGLLVDDGILNWNDKVIDHLPWLRLHDAYVTKELMISDLLCHRSGLGTFDGDLLWFGTDYTSEEVVRRIRELPLRNGFRSRFGYQNVMFIAAGLVVEAVTGKSWCEFVKERILRPLHMDDSSTDLADFKSNSNIAFPHVDGVPLSFISYDNAGPAASINCSVDDALKWLHMWLNDGSIDDTQFLSQRTIGTITSSQMFLNGGPGAEPQGLHFINYGYGWRLMDYAGRKIIRHGGALPGYLSEIVFIPEEDLGIVILMNDLIPIHVAIANKILDVFMNDRDRDYVAETLRALEQYKPVLERQREQRLSARIADTTPSLPLAGYVGMYRDPMYGDAEVTQEDTGLVVTLLPAKELFSARLEHFHFETFKVQFPAPALEFGLVTFHFGSDGQIQKFTIDLPSQDLHFSNLTFVRQNTMTDPPL